MIEKIKNIIFSSMQLRFSMDGLQKLSLALIAPVIGLLTYSIMDARRVEQGLDQLSLKLDRSHVITEKYKREAASTNILNEILKRNSKRNQILFNILEKSRSSINAINLFEIEDCRKEVVIDQGRLAQFDTKTYPLLHDLATSLTNLLLDEYAIWESLQQIFMKHSDKDTNIEEKEKLSQIYSTGLLNNFKHLSVVASILLKTEDQLKSRIDEALLEKKELLTELKNFEDSYNFSTKLFYISIVLIVALIFGVIFCKRQK